MPFEEDIKDIFDSSSLENEGWLEPNDDLFEKISEQVYADREVKRKNIPFYLKWLLLVFVFGGIIYSFIFLKKKEHPINEWATIISSDKNSYSENEPQINYNDIQNVPAIPHSSNPVMTLKKSESKPRNSGNISSNDDNDAFGLTSQSEGNSGIQNSDIYQNHINDILLNNTEKSSNVKNQAKVTFEQNKKLANPLNPITPLNLFIPSLITENKFLPLPIPKLVLSDENSLWETTFSFGLNLRDFKLNKSYSTALDPADFSFQASVGWISKLTIQRNLSKKLQLKLGIAYEDIEFKSGHNSQVSYALEEETSLHTNNISLTMASPVGFIGSSIILQRALNSQVEPVTNLLIDLKNVHRMLQLNYSLGINIRQQLSPIYVIELDAGFGIAHIIGVRNKLISVESNNPDFEFKSSEILKNQSNIQKIRPAYNIGLNIDHRISTSQYIGFQYSFSQDLKPIFKLGDFSSSMFGHQITLRFTQSF